MTRGAPVLGPKVHLVGATPEKLARALLRQPHLAPRTRRKPVVRDEVAVGKPLSRHRSNYCFHLSDGIGVAHFTAALHVVGMGVNRIGMD